VLAGLFSGVILMVVYTKFFGLHDHRVESDSDSDRLVAIEKRLSALQLAQENSRFQNSASADDKELARLRQQMAELLLAVESNEGSAEGDDNSLENEVVDHFFHKSPEERSRIALEQELALRNTLEDNFASDDVADVEWAQGTQDKIEIAFQSAKLAGSSLVSSTCKSNMCKLEISPDLSTVDGDMAMYQNELLVALSGRLSSSALRVEKNQDGSPKIIGYFGRQGSSITTARSPETSVSQ